MRRRRTGVANRYLDALVVDSDVVQLEPDTFDLELWGHCRGGTCDLGGR